MKKLMIFPVLAFLTIGYLKAEDKIAQNNEYTKIDENLNEWVLVKEDNGMKVYFALYEAFDGTNSIKLKFENTSNIDKIFQWEIVNKNTDKIIFESQKNFKIKPNSVLVFFEDNVPYSIEQGTKLSDYSIILKY